MSKGCSDCEAKIDVCQEISGPEVDETSCDCCETISTDCILSQNSDTFFPYTKGTTLSNILKLISSSMKSIKEILFASVGSIQSSGSYDGMPLFSYTAVGGGTPVVIKLPMFLTGLYCFEYEISPGTPDTFTVDSCMGNVTLYDSSSTEITDPVIIADLLEKIRNCETTNIICS